MLLTVFLLSIPHFDNRKSSKKGEIWYEPGRKFALINLAIKAVSMR